MTNKYYKIYRSQAEGFNAALDELLTAVRSDFEQPVRIIFFGSPAGNEAYINERNTIESKSATLFKHKPMLAYIAQAPLCSTLAAEVTAVDNMEVQEIVYHDDYISINNREIISGGIYSDTALTIDQQAEKIFARVSEILNNESVEVCDIVRQWNYIERITHMDEGGQHYQLFNDARSHFYNSCKWETGYPAATGIGTQAGGVIVTFDAIRNSNEYTTPIDNPLQISAHAYSQQVLINSTDKHKTTPKFERARYIGGAKPMIHISGTAAIRGEESCEEGIVGQTALTMENIDHLTSIENQYASGVANPSKMEYTTLRVYIKHRHNLHDAKQWMTDNYPATPALYLWADICREELLIEIEGVAL